MPEIEIAYVTFVEPQNGIPGEMTFEDRDGNPWQPTVDFGVTQSFKIKAKPGTQAIHLRSLTFWFGSSNMTRTFPSDMRGGSTLTYDGVEIDNVNTGLSALRFDVVNHLNIQQSSAIMMEVTVESNATHRFYTSRDPQITLQANQGGTGGGGGGGPKA